MTAGLSCPRCHQDVPSAGFAPALLTCPYCGLPMAVLVGRAAAQMRAMRPETAVGGAATCFFHAENAATVACAQCGRFVCALCDLEMEGLHRCPLCLTAARQAASVASLRERDVLYDSIALTVAWAWILFYPTWLVAAPTVLYLTLRHWKAPRHYLVPRGRWRFLLASAIVLLPVLAVLMLTVSVRRAAL